MTGKEESEGAAVAEYHVVFGAEEGHWQVTWKAKKMEYPAWDKRVAISAAKEMAKKHKPSKVVVHNRNGAVENEIRINKKTNELEKDVRGKFTSGEKEGGAKNETHSFFRL